VIGAGLAGCEAAFQLAERGVSVVLYEMRPASRSPAHFSDDFAELVCSNSLRSNQLGNAVGLLKEEMRRLGSLILREADAHAVPAGRALAVDRTGFSRAITQRLESHPRVEVRRSCVASADALAESFAAVIIATGPLTASALAEELQQKTGEASLYFYDAISPLVYADSLDHEVVFRASRYEEEAGDYLNIPLDEAAYHALVAGLVAADPVPLHSFEKRLFFEGCLPVEEMARRGPETLAHGPLKPVGLRDPRTGLRPYAVIQLRQEDKSGALYNMVGFQTKLRIGAQRALLRAIPGLEGARFARLGSAHRNTYVNAPRCLLPDLRLRGTRNIYLAGQITGVEGYVESAALGGLAALFVGATLRGREHPEPPATTAHAALLRHLREAPPKQFQPTNVTYGLFPPLSEASRPRGRRGEAKRRKHQQLAERALAELETFRAQVAP
jgi:methylenetetrahydrofolate--tRNA-(uracil-5-)-methyltransferase